MDSQLTLEPMAACDPQIGLWLAALEDTRERTLRVIRRIDPAMVDAAPPCGGNTVGMLLYHIGGTEMMWLYTNLLQQPYPPEVAAHFPHDNYEPDGKLAPSAGVGLAEYVAGLRVARSVLVQTYRGMSGEEFAAPLTRQGYWGPYTVTPRWILQHLSQHEAEHRGHLQYLIDALRR